MADTRDQGLITKRLLGAFQKSDVADADLSLTPSDSVSVTDPGGTPSVAAAPLPSRVDIGLFTDLEIGPFQKPLVAAVGTLNTRQTFNVQPGVQWRTHLLTQVPRRNLDWYWEFRLCDATDYATPEPGIGIGTITIEISKDGAAFVGIANAVAETGSGWYRVKVDAADMNWDKAIMKATASGVAQCDEIYYTE